MTNEEVIMTEEVTTETEHVEVGSNFGKNVGMLAGGALIGLAINKLWAFGKKKFNERKAKKAAVEPNELDGTVE